MSSKNGIQNVRSRNAYVNPPVAGCGTPDRLLARDHSPLAGAGYYRFLPDLIISFDRQRLIVNLKFLNFSLRFLPSVGTLGHF